MFSYQRMFICLWLYRFVRFIVNCISHWTFRPISLPEYPTLTSQDVTIIVPTLGGNWSELRETLNTFLRTEPFQIILVTTDANLKHADQMIMSMPTSRIRVLSIPHANKRRQMCCAIPEVQTKITVFADDDVIWGQKILPWILAPFEKPGIGGVGTSQRLRRPEHPNVWDFLGALYLERRNFDISATTHIDGGIPCLSGRTVAYRTHILQDPDFTYGFTHERWLHRYQLNTDDDNFLTRWMVSHGWDTYVQYCKEAEVQTTLEGNRNFLKQCLRWTRSNWRSNLTSMFRERHVWRLLKEFACASALMQYRDFSRQPWSAYAVQLPTLSPPAFLGDFLMVYFCYEATIELGLDSYCRIWTLALLVFWMFTTKYVKLLGHFIRYPSDISLLPVSILFGWFHGFIKVYAFFTLNVTAWGSREGADTDDVYRMIRLNQEENEQ